MSVADFERSKKQESDYYEKIGWFLPVAIFFITLFWVSIDLNNNINPWILIVPLLYPLIFVGIYERKYWRQNKNVSGFYFKKLTYDKAILRYGFLEKMVRNFTIVLIAFVIIAAIGITSSLKSINENISLYDTSYVNYNTQLGKILRMSQQDLRNYFSDAIDNMTSFAIQQNLLNIITTEVNENFTAYDYNSTQRIQEITEFESDKIKNLDEIHQKELLLQKINTMPFGDLKNLVITDLEYSKPNSFFLNENITYSKAIFTMLLYAYVPGIFAYTVFISRYALTGRKDFHYHFAIGCFAIVSGYPDLEEMEKRRYMKEGILHYNKFINKNLKLHIKNLDEVNSRLLINDPESLSRLSQDMENVLATQHSLKLLDSLKKNPNDDNSSILVSTSYLDTLSEKRMGIISILSTISTIVSILSKI